ncbi:AMIN-like domain-containing (lipo)protein [Streptomyces sp. UG1]|uniref:AMIN-like domain-containing (lipo)protein n=1 Tax=Streptomyces sp. UG1 TaxID=3417652 RepID=UPI003CF6840D
MRKASRGALFVATATVSLSLVVAAPTAFAEGSVGTTAAACETGWGSLPKTANNSAPAFLTNIRTGGHDCYDRIVFDIPAGTTSRLGYTVQYVDAFEQEGSGDPIPVSGGAILEVRVQAASYDLDNDEVTYPGKAKQPLPGVDLTGYQTFRDAKFGGSFEGDSKVGLGMRARLPFKVTQLSDKLVVDVAHSW